MLPFYLDFTADLLFGLLNSIFERPSFYKELVLKCEIHFHCLESSFCNIFKAPKESFLEVRT